MQLMMSNVELASDSIVDRVYEQLKAMAVSYEFKPGERLNEGELAKRLGVSRFTFYSYFPQARARSQQAKG